MELSIIAVIIDNLEVTKRFVSSIRQYTQGKYELILVDNASGDRAAAKFCKEESDKHFRFRKRAGLAEAWNKGIEISSGKFVAVVNNDTVVPPQWFGPLKETLTKNKRAGLVSPMTFWIMKHDYLNNSKMNMDRPFRLAKFKDALWGEFMVFKRKALEDVGGFCELYKIASGEDLEMSFQLYSRGYEIYVDPRVFVYHEGAATKTISGKRREKHWRKNYELFKSRWPKQTKDWK